MRTILSEVLRDVVYCALRQVLRDCGYTVVGLRKAYDVVYYQVGDVYHTLYLDKNNGMYIVHDKTQEYNGDLIDEYAYMLHNGSVIDLLNELHFIVERRFKQRKEVKSMKKITCSVCQDCSRCRLLQSCDWYEEVNNYRMGQKLAQEEQDLKDLGDTDGDLTEEEYFYNI